MNLSIPGTFPGNLLRIQLTIAGTRASSFETTSLVYLGHSACIFRGPMLLGRDVAIKESLGMQAQEAPCENLCSQGGFFQ